MRFMTSGIGHAAILSVIATVTQAQLDRSHHPCPRSCAENPKQAGWSSYYSVNDFETCGERTLFTLNPFSPINDPSRQFKIRICTTGDAETRINAITGTAARLPGVHQAGMNVAVSGFPDTKFGRVARRDDAIFDDVGAIMPVCREAANVNATTEWLTWTTKGEPDSGEKLLASLLDTQAFLRDKVNCEESVIYGHHQGALVGIYVGHKIQNSGIANGFVEEFIQRLSSRGSNTERTVAQVCGGDRNSDHHVGIVTDPQGDLAWVQRALRSWAEARCVNDTASGGFLAAEKIGSSIPTSRPDIMSRSNVFSRQGACRRIQAAYGDTLESLAATCNIGTAELRRHNLLADGWKPVPYQWVCCSAGSVSKRAAPGPRPDGSCASYVTVNDDTCSKIAATYGTTLEDLYTYNKETWGWGGCNNLFPGYRICLGPGTPRLPAPNPDAECGPSKPGTQSPLGAEKIEDLSPCNIKACCNIWGKCGVDSDHCIPTKSETGNPGTAAARTNGCVQNCGMEMTNNGSPPASFMKVAYFESWNRERPCLHMSVSQIPSSYTHVHYAFADITESFGVSTGRFTDVFEQFKGLRGPKRIVAFGGWAFSTEPATYHLFRNAVKPENRNTFADACVSFVVTHGLDGVDFDWEYPAEPDITPELIPPGDPEESENYLEFVKVVRAKLPSDKTVSIAAPASYWYLKQFLIAEMSEVVDYIIYMTYDLHGQWDFGSKWSQPGCSGGNCLRSHVNMTETMSSLAMITKAGVMSNKVVVGVTSYGRSFKMTYPTCEGPMCTYTGPESGAEPGKCTGTGGYISDGEIAALISEGRVSRQWKDSTESDYIIYDGNWVAYMDKANKEARIEKYRALNFRGSTDWAVDLQVDVGAADNHQVVYLNTLVYSGTAAQCTAPCLFVFPPSALPSASTITLPAYKTSIQIAPGTTSTITVQAPPLTVTSMQYSNFNVSSGMPTGSLRPSISLDVPPIITTISAQGGGVITRTLYLPPWPAMTRGPPSDGNKTETSTGAQWTPTSVPIPAPSPIVTWPAPEKPEYTPGPDEPELWPETGEIKPVTEDVPEEGEDDDGDGSKSKSTCKLWFFFICIRWDDFNIRIGGWEWDLPPGIWGPGPPPIDRIKLPPGFTFKGTLPPWPEITVLPNGQIAPPPKPADCVAAEASLCFTTLFFATTVAGTSTKTTETQTKETCATVTGCNLRDVATTTSVEACTLGRDFGVQATEIPRISSTEAPPQKRTSGFDWRRKDKRGGPDAIIWPVSNDAAGQTRIIELLEERKEAQGTRGCKVVADYKVFKSDDLDHTAFYWLFNVGQASLDYFASRQVPEVALIYWPDKYAGPGAAIVPNAPNARALQSKRESSRLDGQMPRFELQSTNTSEESSTLKRREDFDDANEYWHLSQISFPPNVVFDKDDGSHDYTGSKYRYRADNSWGRGQTIYVIESLPVLDILDPPLEGQVSSLPYEEYGKPFEAGAEEYIHSSLVTSFAAGRTVGIARNANVFNVRFPVPDRQAPAHYPIERIWEALLIIANHQSTRSKNSAVVNMSFTLAQVENKEFYQRLTKILQLMADKYGIIFTTGAGNDGRKIRHYPALSAPFVPGMMVVGATDFKGLEWSENGTPAEIMAPGVDLKVSTEMRSAMESRKAGEGKRPIDGTSFASPMVAGLAAYFRASPHYDGLDDPASIMAYIHKLRRPLILNDGGNEESKRLVWNGFGTTCSPGENTGLVKRQASCPLPGNPGSTPQGPSVEYKPGPPAPLCTGSDCGKLCVGFWCTPDTQGQPPDGSGPSTSPPFTLPPDFTVSPGPSVTAGPGEWCLSTTTVRQCNGGPRGAACITTTSCASFGRPDLPTLTSGGGSSPSAGSCVSSTTWFELGGPKFEATITKSSCASWSTPPPPTPTTPTTATTPTAQPSPTAKPARCITGRTYEYNNAIIYKDGIHVLVWDNGKLVCDQRESKRGVSEDTKFHWDCGGGASVDVTTNGASVKYTAADGWSGTLDKAEGQRDYDICGQIRDKDIKCLWLEYTFRTGQCDKCPTPKLCGSTDCKFDGTCQS